MYSRPKKKKKILLKHHNVFLKPIKTVYHAHNSVETLLGQRPGHLLPNQAESPEAVNAVACACLPEEQGHSAHGSNQACTGQYLRVAIASILAIITATGSITVWWQIKKFRF